ncbi:MAG: UPF0182 family protein [Candidatus Schekmanbacteria bacterium]|nr:MAG: UPF0182 family protein [Candidatus Schekmanbacteria bacterium]
MRIFLIIFLLIAFVIPLFFNFIDLSVDFLWFSHLGYTQIFKTTLLAKIITGITAGGIFFIISAINIFLAGRRKPLEIPRTSGNIIELPEIDRYSEQSSRFAYIAAIFLAYILSTWGASNWELALKYLNSLPFNIKDPLFSKDISFYIFKLPLIKVFYELLLVSLLFSIIISATLYFLRRNIIILEKGVKISEFAKKHFLILAGVLLFLFSYKFVINQYELLFSERGVIFGAGYTDINASLPVLKIISWLCIALGMLLISNVFYPSYKAALSGIIIIVVFYFAGIKGYPEFIQRFQVAPNELVKEKKYIDYAIKFTNTAYGLNNIEERPFPASENLTKEDIEKNNLTIKNIRLWNEEPLLSTFAQLQEIRTYYDFVGVDNDRYMIDGEYRQVALSPRELSYKNLPSRIWINEHLTYTHGYGICVSPVNQKSEEGLPELFIKDIPPKSLKGPEVKRPEIYYGEIANDYCFVNTESKEFDYPSGDKNIYTHYQGNGGVQVDSFLKKVLFALKFKEIKILLASDIKPESRIMFYRKINERVKHLTPFLKFDSDPYIVISDDGKLFWIIDAYTFTANYPYSDPTKGYGNYIRNSVKVVIDAYEGSVDYYIVDDRDPIIKVYDKIFPGVFKKFEKMPKSLKKHIRYPRDLFLIQALKYSAYHMKDSQVFYNKEDLWKIPSSGTNQGLGIMKPYYMIMKLSSGNEYKEEFILMIPFTPSRKNNMIAWMAARCDMPNYGKLIVYNFPKQKLVYGPQQIDSRIDQNPEISKQLTLWNQGGSSVIRGSLLVIPIEKSILYVQPLYLSATQSGGLPELKRVIVAFENEIVMEETLNLAIEKIFGKIKKIGKEKIEKTTESKEENANEILNKIRKFFNKALEQMRKGDWAGYGQSMKEIQNLLIKNQ